MIITALNEQPETRVAITPLSVKPFQKLGLEVLIEENAGIAAGFSDQDYQLQGATLAGNARELLKQTQILLSVSAPNPDALTELPPQAFVVTPVDAEESNPLVSFALKQRISLFSMDKIPRITRAQSMDSLSSQANLAGYRAVLEGIHHYKRAIPMMMTAAGMIKPAKILILGAGVAGLQAIATAKRMGAVVYAFDVRRAAKEQVESLGAEFVEVSAEYQEAAGGYAGETSDDYKKRQKELILQYAQLADIIVTTALIPGHPSPVLLDKQTVENMRPGSVIVDAAASRGGNCELTVKNNLVEYQGITIIGYSNFAGLVPATASELFSGNFLNLIKSLMNPSGKLNFNPEDEIIQQAMLCHDGVYMPFQKLKETQP